MKLFATFAALFALATAEDTCSIKDHNNPRVNSWRTNCPSGCEIYDYLNIAEDKVKTSEVREAQNLGHLRT